MVRGEPLLESHQPSAIGCLPSAICRLPAAVFSSLPSAVSRELVSSYTEEIQTPPENGGVAASADSQHLRGDETTVRASRRSLRPLSVTHDVFSSVVYRAMELCVTVHFTRECHKDFSRTFTVENTIQKVCNLSHVRSSCTVARSSNRVILDPHFSPSMLPSRALQLPATTLRRCSQSQ